MADLLNIRKALETPLFQMAQQQGIAVEWPNFAFDTNQLNPTTQKPITEYVRFGFFPDKDDPQTLGPTPQYQNLGFIKCDVFVQSGAGGDRADAIRSLIKAAYPYASNLTREGVNILLLESASAAGVVYQNWYYLPLNINWAVWS